MADNKILNETISILNSKLYNTFYRAFFMT